MDTTTLEADILAAIPDEHQSAAILAKLAATRRDYDLDRTQAVESIRTQWDAATAIQVRAGDETQAALDAREATIVALNDRLARLGNPQPLDVPTVTNWQFKQALIAAMGILPDEITGLLAAIPDPIDRAKALVDWSNAETVRRDHALIPVIAAQLGKTDAEIDALFAFAATL